MASKIFVAVGGKYGDLCATAIPLLYRLFKETGESQNLMVSKEYASILEGCSYITPLVWDGEWSDLNGALKLARTKFPDVVQVSTFGKDHSFVKKTPSFQLEQWRLAGYLDQFDECPLVFDNRNEIREIELVQKYAPRKKPYILYADHSQSSPFPYSDDLIQLLKEKFGRTHKIIRLSEVKAEKIYDLAALYDGAVALVSIETVHLHLSAASGVPVIALVTDRPEIWHGTAYQKRFSLHCRYSDYVARKGEIVAAIKSAVAIEEIPELTITGKGGYNQSIAKVGDKTIGVYRYHPDPNHWRTQLAIWDGEKTCKVIPPAAFTDYSIEDARLFTHNGKLHASYTAARTVNNELKCVVQYGELVPDGAIWKIVNHFQPAYKGNDFSSMQKNWSFWNQSGKLYAAYQRSPEQIVLEIDGDKIVQQFNSESPEWAWGSIRGGTEPIEHNGAWLQFFHSSTRGKVSAWSWHYYIGALLMEKQAPFKILSVSKFPIAAGTEKYFSGLKFWKPKVTFCCGAIKTDSGFSVSVGINDSATGQYKLKEKHLNL